MSLRNSLLFLFACSSIACSAPDPQGTGGGAGGNSGGGSATGGGGGSATGGGGGSATGGGSAGGSSTGGGSGGGFGGGSAGGSAGGSTQPDGGLTPEQLALLSARPYRTVVPTGYTPSTPVPLVVLLHGYGASGLVQDQYFRFSQLANAKTFILVTPDGTVDPTPKAFWNATDACCNFFGSPVDDVKYLTAVLDDTTLKYRIDSKRVFVVGHSNGGFMSHRLACDRADRIAAIVSLAGALYKDQTRCTPANPISVLQVHGTADDTVAYDGGTFVASFPGAEETIADWASLNGCLGLVPDAGANLDIVTNLAGAETRRSAWACSAGAAELWTIPNGGHIPMFDNNWGEAVWGFLSAHPKP